MVDGQQPEPHRGEHMGQSESVNNHTGQPVLARTLVKKWRILLEQNFTTGIPLLSADCH